MGQKEKRAYIQYFFFFRWELNIIFLSPISIESDIHIYGGFYLKLELKPSKYKKSRGSDIGRLYLNYDWSISLSISKILGIISVFLQYFKVLSLIDELCRGVNEGTKMLFWLLSPHILHFGGRKWKRYGRTMPLAYKPHPTSGCIDSFCNAFGWYLIQSRQFCLFTNQLSQKWAS